jgi:pyruvate ferredoxin oxidoreductase alpha subunit
MLTQEQVDDYLPPFKPFMRLDAAEPVSMGMYATPDYYMEFRYEIDQAMDRSMAVWQEAGAEFGEKFGRDYASPVEEYRLDDADVAFVAMGSICGTIKDAIDEMREAGMKAGLLKLRCYRPFPRAEVAAALKNVSKVAVVEKNLSIGSAMKGAVGYEVMEAVGRTGPEVYSYVAGLGGRDLRRKDFAAMAVEAMAGRGNCFYGLRQEVL